MVSRTPAPGAPDGQKLVRAPALQALLIQFVSFTVILAIAYGTNVFSGTGLPVALAALMQGAVAAAISRWRSMASWWLVIQFLFPVAVVVVHAFQVPPWIFLLGFILLLGLYWTTFRTQVPFFPSTRATWGAVERLLPQGRRVRFIDIGSGFGGLSMHIARANPDVEVTGIEVAPLPWLTSVLRARANGSSARFVRGDYDNFDLGGYDVVFAYLSPAAMPALWRKAQREMGKGALLLSYEFAIPCIEPHVFVRPLEDGPPLYGWYL